MTPPAYRIRSPEMSDPCKTLSEVSPANVRRVGRPFRATRPPVSHPTPPAQRSASKVSAPQFPLAPAPSPPTSASAPPTVYPHGREPKRSARLRPNTDAAARAPPKTADRSSPTSDRRSRHLFTRRSAATEAARGPDWSAPLMPLFSPRIRANRTAPAGPRQHSRPFTLTTVKVNGRNRRDGGEAGGTRAGAALRQRPLRPRPGPIRTGRCW